MPVKNLVRYARLRIFYFPFEYIHPVARRKSKLRLNYLKILCLGGGRPEGRRPSKGCRDAESALVLNLTDVGSRKFFDPMTSWGSRAEGPERRRPPRGQGSRIPQFDCHGKCSNTHTLTHTDTHIRPETPLFAA